MKVVGAGRSHDRNCLGYYRTPPGWRLQPLPIQVQKGMGLPGGLTPSALPSGGKTQLAASWLADMHVSWPRCGQRSCMGEAWVMEVGHHWIVESWRRRDGTEVMPLWVQAEPELWLQRGLGSWREGQPGSAGIIYSGAPDLGEGWGGY